MGLKYLILRVKAEDMYSLQLERDSVSISKIEEAIDLLSSLDVGMELQYDSENIDIILSDVEKADLIIDTPLKTGQDKKEIQIDFLFEDETAVDVVNRAEAILFDQRVEFDTEYIIGDNAKGRSWYFDDEMSGIRIHVSDDEYNKRIRSECLETVKIVLSSTIKSEIDSSPGKISLNRLVQESKMNLEKYQSLFSKLQQVEDGDYLRDDSEKIIDQVNELTTEVEDYISQEISTI